jgi:hypothetical protein
MALASDKIIGYICGVKKYKSQDSEVKEFTIFFQQVYQSRLIKNNYYE